jgi:leader peptidase (prepilin peptidase)/N-methyltransferase
MMNFLTELFATLSECFNAPMPVFASFAGIIGLLVGSFLNVVIVRLPKMIDREFAIAVWYYRHEKLTERRAFKQQALQQGLLQTIAPVPPVSLNAALDSPKLPEHLQGAYNLYKPASHCPQCKAGVRWWMNIPLLSYLVLKGRCAGCALPISLQYPLVECIAAGLGVLAAVYFGDTLGRGAACAMMLLLWALLSLTVIDFQTKYLPDAMTQPLLWLGLVVNMAGVFTTPTSAIWGAIAGYLSLWSVCYGYKLLTGKVGMGNGDFKLLAALGAWLGVGMIVPILLLASLTGSVIGLGLIVFRRSSRDTYIAFGPYLAIAGGIAALYGHRMINAYLAYARIGY